MKQIPLRLDNDIYDEIEEYIRVNNITSKQTAYRQLLRNALDMEKRNHTLLLEKIGKIVLENKYFIQKLYRINYDKSHSKFDSPDEEFSKIDCVSRKAIIDCINAKNKGIEDE